MFARNLIYLTVLCSTVVKLLLINQRGQGLDSRPTALSAAAVPAVLAVPPCCALLFATILLCQGEVLEWGWLLLKWPVNVRSIRRQATRWSLNLGPSTSYILSEHYSTAFNVHL
jgi:hypothetical protein